MFSEQEPPLDVDESTVFEALGNETARKILVRTADRPRSARDLADATGTSHTTVYRWLERLEEHDLVDQDLRIDMDGNHHHVYSTAIERLEIEIASDGLDVRVEWREDTADRLTRMWEDIRR